MEGVQGFEKREESSVTVTANEIIQQFNAMHGKIVRREDLQAFLKSASRVPGTDQVQLRLMAAIGKWPVGEHRIEVDLIPLAPTPEKARALPVKAQPKPPVRRPVAKPAPHVHAKGKAVTKPARTPAPQVPAGLYGITRATETPPQSVARETLPGEIGAFLGALQRYKLAIVISGETHSSKSEIGKQIADAFMSAGDDVLWIDWEQGGLASSDTRESIDRNIAPGNRSRLHVSGDIPRDVATLLELAKQFPVIVLDSGTKVKEHGNEWIDLLREKAPDTVWIPLMQQTVAGGTKGGSSAEFDAPVVIKTQRPDQSDYRRNYAYLAKSRGNKTGKYYNIAAKKIIPLET